MKFAKSKPLVSPSLIYDYWPDILTITLLLVLTGLMTYLGTQLINPELFLSHTEDVWFGSDIGRVIGNVSDRQASFRSAVHPLFALFIYPFVALTQLLTGTSPVNAIHLVMAVTAALWVSLFFIILRLIGCQRLDASLYCVLLLTSSAFWFWATVPESYLFGSLSMVLPLGVVALSQHRKLSPLWYIVTGVISLSITTTNWMAGLFATFVMQKWRRSLWITGSTLLSVSALWVVQKRFFPKATFFIGSDVLKEELKYALPHTSGGPIRVFLAFIYHSLIMPAIQLIPSNRNQPEWPMLTVQFSWPGSGDLWSVVSVLLWTGLLTLGVWALVKTRQNFKFRLTLGLILLGQFVLHILYGQETFLYAIHIAPFLLFLSALATLTRLRILTLTLVVMLILSTGINNSVKFKEAADFLGNTGPLRQRIPVQIQSFTNSQLQQRV